MNAHSRISPAGVCNHQQTMGSEARFDPDQIAGGCFQPIGKATRIGSPATCPAQAAGLGGSWPPSACSIASASTTDAWRTSRAPDVAESALAVNEPPAARGGGEMHQPDRLVRRAAARPGNAGDRHREIGRAHARARPSPSLRRFPGSPRRGVRASPPARRASSPWRRCCRSRSRARPRRRSPARRSARRPRARRCRIPRSRS